MFYALSKFLPLFVYPVGFASLGILAALILGRKEKTRKWQTAILILVLASLWLSGNRVVSLGLNRLLEWQFPPLQETPRVDAIVVLGGGTDPKTWPRPTHEVRHAGDRMLYAARLYHDGAAPVIIVSGGLSPIGDTTVSEEAVAMADILMLAGVPEEAIILEGQSINTYYNAVYTYEIMQERGYERIALVTSALHMPRAARIFAKFDMDVVPAPTDYRVTAADWHYYTQPNLVIQLYNFMPNVKSMERTSEFMKEVIGLIVYKLRGWI